MRRRHIIAGVVSSVTASLLAWMLLPIDLIPSCVSFGSYDRSEASDFAHVRVHPGDIRDVVGLLVPEAEKRLRVIGLGVYEHKVSLWPGIELSDLMIRSDGVLLTVLLGRVVRAERPAKT